MIGDAQTPEWLETRMILSAFGDGEASAVEHCSRFVAEGNGQPCPWEHLRNLVFLGSEAVAENMRRQIPKDRDLTELPQARQRPPAKSIGDYVRESPDRNASIVAAYQSGGYTLRDIGVFFGLYTTPESAKSFKQRTPNTGRQKGRPLTPLTPDPCPPGKTENHTHPNGGQDARN